MGVGLGFLHLRCQEAPVPPPTHLPFLPHHLDAVLKGNHLSDSESAENVICRVVPPHYDSTLNSGTYFPKRMPVREPSRTFPRSPANILDG